ncbi:MAG: DUF3300 domain-containing protein [Acidiferrobacterales bacterium]
MSTAQLDQMLAPIALYPDSLLGPILIASTYPLEVVEADRWLQDPNNASLRGDELAQALQDQTWDPSVKSLVPFPQVLQMMDNNLDWTERLGDTFLAQQNAVMDSVQGLRRDAVAAGTLTSSHQQVVKTEEGAIVIEPASPDVVYVPVYSPVVVYGAWPYPDYPPYFFPWPGIVIGVNIGFPIFEPFWDWDRWDWHHRRIDIDSTRFNRINVRYPPIVSGPWHHDPDHRHGVPYRNPAVQARFGRGDGDMVQKNFRGYGRALPGRRVPAAPLPNQRTPRVIQPMRQAPRLLQPANRALPVMRPAPRIPRPLAPAFESYGRGREVRVQEQRGARSRNSAPAESGRSAPRRGGNRKER